MSILKFGLLILLLQNAHAESSSYEAVTPVGSIRKDSTVSLKPVDANTSYMNMAAPKSNSADFEILDNKSLYRVQSIQSADTSSDTTDLQTLAEEKQLVVQGQDLQAQNSNCSTSGNTTNCRLSEDLPVYKSGGFDFFNWFLNLFGLGHKETPAPVVTVTPKVTEALPDVKDRAMASAMVQKIDQINTVLGQKKPAIPNCLDNLPPEQRNNSKFVCGFRQAQEAFKTAKASGKVTQDIFIFNDFSSGGVMGKMWFFNSDGSLAQVTDKNPIWVSRGEGGFGQGVGSLKTPNGAIVTRPYHPPRAANIKDGIELEGLEEGNRDIHARGVLLHGWDPYTPTQGCLGIPGTLTTARRGRASLGGVPPYLDQLKKGFLKDGGVMIYNFTPKKVEQCGT